MANIKPSKDSVNQPSPDNQGIELNKPKNLDEAAAEANRDIAELMKIDSKQNKKEQNKEKQTKE